MIQHPYSNKRVEQGALSLFESCEAQNTKPVWAQELFHPLLLAIGAVLAAPQDDKACLTHVILGGEFVLGH
eukprot:scaffold19933_cov18-Tisochrysis_lutea.AAC.6